MTMALRFWGVRGSVPAPGPATANVGGNTSCVELTCGDQVVILDGGTGLRGLGDDLIRRGTPVRASILFSHVHWDHIQGVPFFAPVFRPETELDMYGAPEEGSIHDVLQKQMTYPNFPVKLDNVPATLSFKDVRIGETIGLGYFNVRAAALNHPNGVMAYRVECGGRSVVFATDTEHYEDGRIDEALVELANNADILIYDAQFTPEEYDGRDGMARKGWGHSTFAEGVRVARAANVSKLILFHHDPSHDDAKVREIEEAAAAELPGTVAAREGLQIDLKSNLHRKAA